MASPRAAPAARRTGRLPVTVISGFLGAGKTTLLRRLLREQPGLRTAVIANDRSELAVDADLVRELKEGEEELVIDLHAGSLGGALRPAFREALNRVAADRTIAYLLIETSGGSYPRAILDDIGQHAGLELDTLVTVVDGLNLLRDFDAGRALLPVSAQDDSAAGVLRAQVEVASVILASEADRLTRVQATDLLDVLRRLNPRALLMAMAYGLIDAAVVMGSKSDRARQGRERGGPRRRVPIAEAPDDPARLGLGAEVLRDVRPLHPGRLHAAVREALPVAGRTHRHASCAAPAVR